MEMSPLVSVVSFVFVIGLLLATLWFVRSRGIGIGPMTGQDLKVVNSLRLGGKHRLDIVEYGDRRLLLGIAPNQITLLDSQPLIPLYPMMVQAKPQTMYQRPASRPVQRPSPANSDNLCTETRAGGEVASSQEGATQSRLRLDDGRPVSLAGVLIASSNKRCTCVTRSAVRAVPSHTGKLLRI